MRSHCQLMLKFGLLYFEDSVALQCDVRKRKVAPSTLYQVCHINQPTFETTSN